jgi:glycerol uptake facilitator-like aquaporin
MRIASADPAFRADSSEASSASLLQRVVVEGMATAYLLAIIVGSGVMAERLAGGNRAIALLANSLASGAGLTVLILTFGSISGSHMNPIVTLSEAFRRTLPWTFVPGYLGAQFGGAFLGVAAAHAMFGLPVFSVSRHERAGIGQVFGEFVATFGLIVVIRGATRLGLAAVACVVGLYIFAAYWFTSSTSFANPAVTLARAFSDTFVGIRPSDVPGFLAGQTAAGLAAVASLHWLGPNEPGGTQ